MATTTRETVRIEIDFTINEMEWIRNKVRQLLFVLPESDAFAVVCWINRYLDKDRDPNAAG